MDEYFYISDAKGEKPKGLCHEIAIRINGVKDGWPQYEQGPTEFDRYSYNGQFITRDEFVRLKNEAFAQLGWPLRVEAKDGNTLHFFQIETSTCPAEPL